MKYPKAIHSKPVLYLFSKTRRLCFRGYKVNIHKTPSAAARFLTFPADGQERPFIFMSLTIDPSLKGGYGFE